jgi:hypothetical protein
MSSEVKTSLGKKISDILSLISNPKSFELLHRLLPIIDYEYIMTEKQELKDVSQIAGNTTTQIILDDGEELEIIYGRFWCDTDATAGNRTPMMKIRDQVISTNLGDWRANNVGPNETMNIFIYPTDIGTTDNVSSNEFWALPSRIQPEDLIELQLFGGVAGDWYKYWFRVKNRPVSKEWIT